MTVSAEFVKDLANDVTASSNSAICSFFTASLSCDKVSFLAGSVSARALSLSTRPSVRESCLKIHLPGRKTMSVEGRSRFRQVNTSNDQYESFWPCQPVVRRNCSQLRLSGFICRLHSRSRSLLKYPYSTAYSTIPRISRTKFSFGLNSGK